MAVEVWFTILLISRTEKKNNVQVLKVALMKKICEWQLAFLGHVLRRHGLENLVLTGKIERKRARRRQRLKYLDSLSASWKDNVSPAQLMPWESIRAPEDKVLWHCMVANVINDDMHHNNNGKRSIVTQNTLLKKSLSHCCSIHVTFYTFHTSQQQPQTLT